MSSEYLSGESVYLGQESRIKDALKRGGVAVVRLYYDVEHYVLLTGIEDGKLLLFNNKTKLTPEKTIEYFI